MKYEIFSIFKKKNKNIIGKFWPKVSQPYNFSVIIYAQRILRPLSNMIYDLIASLINIDPLFLRETE